MNNSLFDLTGRVALITGGSKGLGKAMATGLAEAGADIIIASRHENELQDALDEITASSGVRGAYFVTDMNDREQVKALAANALERMGKVDILINNAGSNAPEEAEHIKEENWDRIVELNLTSCMLLTRELIPQMKQRQWGRIIHLSSIMGLSSAQGRGVYSATKSALIGLARASALELGEHGITVNCIAPGPFLTDLPKTMFTKEQQDHFSQRTALKRWGDPKELIGPALLLASDAGSYITASTLLVDGGCIYNTF